MVYIKNFNQTVFLSEILRLRKELTKSVFRLKRIRNFISLQLFRLFGITNPLPYSIVIEPTSVCDLKCPMCPKMQIRTDLPEGFMGFKNFKKLIDEIKDHVFLVMLYNNGESLLHSKIINMIEYTKKNNILTQISTHLSFKNDKKIKALAHSGLDFISVTLDGAKKKTYERYRKGGDFDQVIKNIKLLVRERKKTPIIEIQFIVMKENEHEIEDMRKLAKSLKVDRLTLKAVFTHNKHSDKRFQPTNEEYKLIFKKQDKCLKPFSHAIISWNGLMFPCCSVDINLHRRYSYGNVFKESFKKVWFSEEYRGLRETLLKKGHKVKICQNCFTNNILKNRVVFKSD